MQSEENFCQKSLISAFEVILQPLVHPLCSISTLLYSFNYRAIFDAPLQHMCLNQLGTCIKNCSIVKQLNKSLILKLLDKCGTIKLHPFGTMTHVPQFAWAHVPKGCNFIAPLTLMEQFLIALFFHYSPLRNEYTVRKSLRVELKRKQPYGTTLFSTVEVQAPT